MPHIRSIEGLEILDSRGRPTVKATCVLRSGASASASVPSGASTGGAEAVELRDGDSSRFGGYGCLKAISQINGEINRRLSGKAYVSQAELDRTLIDLDGTVDKSRLGANAILAVSIAYARACALEVGTPLYRYFAEMLGQPITRLPRPTVNLFSGGRHGGQQVAIQDVLMVPATAESIRQSLELTHAVYSAAVELLAVRFDAPWLTADEGGLAPPVNRAEELLELAIQAIKRAGLTPGLHVSLAMDVASSQFFRDGVYRLDGKTIKSPEMIKQLGDWARRYPIVSLEDGLAEEDWEHWPELCRQLSPTTLTLGDDLLCTHPRRIQKAIRSNACNALLLKVNQIGSLTEALEACRLARDAGWMVTVSARSGETEDDWYSDLAVGWSGHQTKIGSITQSERLAKYNRLLEIEREMPLPMIPWPH